MLRAVLLYKSEDGVQQYNEDYGHRVGYLPEKHRYHRSSQQYHDHNVTELPEEYPQRAAFPLPAYGILTLSPEPFLCFLFC